MSPRPDVSEERTNQILEAAMKVFAERGFNEARMDDIVEESGLSKGTLYWYFNSKDAIIGGILDIFFDHEMQDLRKSISAEGSATDRLRALINRIGREIDRMMKLLPITYEFYAVATRNRAVRERLGGYFTEYRALLIQLIEQGVAAGEFRPVDPEETATTLIAIFEGLMLLMIINPEAVDWQTHTHAAFDTLLAGLLVTRPAP